MFDPILVHEWLSRAASRHPRKHALICGETRWTYEAIDRHSSALAHALADMGVSRHDRVAVLLDNSVESVVALYGILKAGAVFSILAATLKGAKLRYILDNSDASVLISHTNKSKVVIDAFSGYGKPCKVVWVGPSERIPAQLGTVSAAWESLFSGGFSPETNSAGKSSESALPRIIDQDLAALIYTSGSTGEPKGVMSTHLNMVCAARSISQYLENTEDDIILDVLPLSFDYGLYQVIMAFMFGGAVVLEDSFVYLHKILKRIEEERVTGFPIVPTIVAMLLKMEDLGKYDFRSIRYLSNTGAALPVEHIKAIRRIFPQAQLYSMFGLTECKRVGYLPPSELDRRPESVGKAMPNCETFVLDEDGREAPPGEVGELVIRGTNVMQGYWKDPELTARTYRPGRYPSERVLYSGDYFRKDEEGYLYFLGRKDDMIKSRGERISAKELENLLHSMDGVGEAAVIGVPDEILGQAIKVFVVPKAGAQISEREVAKYCTENAEAFMVPKYVEIVDGLPRTHHGKIDKKVLV